MVRYASHLAHHQEAVTAVEVAADHVDHDLRGSSPSLVVVMASDALRHDAADLRDAVARRYPDARIVGSVVPGGVIGAGEEAESGAAVSLWAADLPAEAVDVRIVAGPDDLPDDGGVLVLLADPFSVDADRLLHDADERGIGVVGGFTGGHGPGGARLIADGRVVESGAVGVRVALPGVRAVVSQGARPIGSDLVVTRAEGNVVVELAGRPAVEQLHALLETLGAEDLRLAREGLLGGLVVDENQPDYDVGDFLVRTLLGVDPGSGGVAIAAEPRVGQTFRFHVRDATGAGADLRRALGEVPTPAGGLLLFACNGRGRRMFGVRDHDAGVVAEVLGVPVAGAFCQGELGPVAGVNHVHAFTATLAAFPA
jgi:small ligand-binding sensory domain FIST